MDSEAISNTIMPEVSGKLSERLVLLMAASAIKHRQENKTTSFQLVSGFCQRLIEGIIPDCLNVKRNQPRYIHTKPDNPITPLVNELAPHGPSGAMSNSV